MEAFVKSHRCQNCRLILDRCICDLLKPLDSEVDMTLLLHAKEMGRVSNTGLIAKRVIRSIREVHYGTPDYRFSPDDIYDENRMNLILYPEANVSFEELVLENSPSEMNIVVPDGNWTQAYGMTKKLISSGKFRPAKLRRPVGGRYWLRMEHNHEAGVSTLEAIATLFEVMKAKKEAEALRSSLEVFVYNSLMIRSKMDLAKEYLESSAYLDPKLG